jgi:hypothetical protein
MAQPYTGETYRVRASNPMSVTTRMGYFVWHTFMAEISKVDVYHCYTDDLPKSSEFRGQAGEHKPGEGKMSASFTRLNIIGGDTFQGKIAYSPTYEEEGSFY